MVEQKYLKGLSRKEKKEKVKNIKESRELLKEGKEKEAFEKAKERPTTNKTRQSSFTTQFKKLHPNVKPLTKEFTTATGIPLKDQRIIFNKGKAAFVNAGSRASVSSPEQWGMARILAFYIKARKKPDKINQDMEIYERLKNKIK